MSPSESHEHTPELSEMMILGILWRAKIFFRCLIISEAAYPLSLAILMYCE